MTQQTDMKLPAQEMTANELLKRIRAERRAAGLPPAAEIDEDEVPGLPEGWTWASVEELSACEENAMTDGPFGSNLKTEHYVPEAEGAAQVITLGNLGVGEFVNEKRYFISRERYENLTKHHVFPGDLLIAALADPVGRCCAVPDHILPALVKADCFRFKPHPLMSRDYVMNYFNSPEGRQRFEELAHGTGRLRVNLTETKSIPVPVPPPSVQEYIAKKQNILLSHAQHANDYLTAIPPLIDKFRQSVLARAFTGELTADWRKNHPDVEPASQLLERIKVERRKKWIENYARKLADRARKRNQKKGKPFTDDDWQAYFDKKLKAGAKKYEEPEPVDPEKEDLPEIPETWEWVPFELVANIATNLKDPGNYQNLPHIAPNYVESETGRLLDYNTIGEDGVTSNKHHFFPGQIIYSKIRPYLCKAVLVDFEGLCSADMYPIDAFINAPYLHWWMISPRFTMWASQEQGRTVLPKINIDGLSSVRVPVAPVLEQQAIAARVAEQFEIVQSFERTVSESHERLLQLRNSLLSDAIGPHG